MKDMRTAVLRLEMPPRWLMWQKSLIWRFSTTRSSINFSPKSVSSRFFTWPAPLQQLAVRNRGRGERMIFWWFLAALRSGRLVLREWRNILFLRK